MSRSFPQIKVRLAPDLYQWLREQAEQNRRSITGEVAALIDAARRKAGGADADL